MPDSEVQLSIQQKALSVNLEAAIYGTIVEIGAGQEVARQFFSAGGAAGTIAKTMSAYDMKVSDEIYGAANRYRQACIRTSRYCPANNAPALEIQYQPCGFSLELG